MSDPKAYGFYYDGKNDKQAPAATYTGGIIGANPDREDGTWPTPTIAYVAFAMKFGDLCSALQGQELFVRKCPKLEEVRDDESDEVRYRMLGRFAWKIQQKQEGERNE